MTIGERLNKEPKPATNLPESIFEVKSNAGEKLTLCWASFVSPLELEGMIARHPRLMEYEIVKEHFTRDELLSISRERSAK